MADMDLNRPTPTSPATQHNLLNRNDMLDGDDVVEGVQCRVQDIFA